MSDLSDLSDLSDPARTLRVDLPSLAVVDATGADAAAFLQAQLCNDLAGAGAGRACLAGYCNPKGRLLALMLVSTLPDGALRLIVPRELVEGLLQRLRMFVLRSDVTFTPRETLRCRGMLVPEAISGQRLAHGVPELPATPPGAMLEVLGGESGAAGAQICRWHDAYAPEHRRRYLVVSELGSAAGDSGDAGEGGEGTELVGEGAGEILWRLGDISAGIPRIVQATREAFVPQMVNLQLVDGLSFRKGCYPGQEIVARMQYLGKLKRHMRRFRTRSEAGSAIAPGSVLVGADDAEAGTVVDAATGPDGTELLAVVRIAADLAGLRAGDAVLEPLPLPYALSTDEAEGAESASVADGGASA